MLHFVPDTSTDSPFGGLLSKNAGLFFKGCLETFCAPNLKVQKGIMCFSEFSNKIPSKTIQPKLCVVQKLVRQPCLNDTWYMAHLGCANFGTTLLLFHKRHIVSWAGLRYFLEGPVMKLVYNQLSTASTTRRTQLKLRNES